MNKSKIWDDLEIKYKIRTFEEVHDDIADIDFDISGEGVITGEEYEDWVKERFRNLMGENNI
ncbi:TPA: hypothetical protein ACF2DE_002916 [Clostridium perfringens]